MPNWSDFFPDAAYAGAFGTGTPQEEATRAPTPVDNAVGKAGKIAMIPGQAYNSQTPISTDQMVGPATDLASFVTLGSGAMPAEANSLRMGIKAYHGSPHDFSEFKAGTSGNYGPAAYFHTSAEDAARYRPPGGKVYEADLDIKKPFDMDKPVSAEDAAAILRATGNHELADSVAASGEGYRNGNELWYWGMGQGKSQAEKAAALRSAGYDSLIGDPGREITGTSTRSPEIAVYDPNLVSILGKRGITAYHGSPHDFDRFDMNKIGTGEGAQAYGYGLYFAKHEPVAQRYRDQLQWKGANFDDPQVLAQNALDRHGGDRGLAADNLQSSMDSVNRFHRGKPPPAQAAANEKTQQAINLLRGDDPITGKPNAPGRMYEVNINADPAHFLDWDKPLSEQTPYVQDAVSRHLRKVPGSDDMIERGGKIMPWWQHELESTSPQKLARTQFDANRASQQLREAGIPGIKYLDQGSRGVRTPQEAKGLLESARADLAKNPDNQQLQLTVKQLEKQASGPEPSHNYVVFDDNLIDILRKYGWAGIAALPALQSREDHT